MTHEGEDPPLYAWQADALAAWSRSGKQGIVEAVTGTGKTRVGVEAILDAAGEDRRAAVLVPTKELQQQWHRRLRREKRRWKIGLLGDGHRATLRDADVVVAIINSARGYELRPPRGSLVVADECHRYASEENITALSVAFEQRLGLTATLERSDRKERLLIDYFGEVCYRIGYPRALADAVIAPFSIAFIGVTMSPDEAAEYEALSKQIGTAVFRLIEQYGFVTEPFWRFMEQAKIAADDPWHRAHDTARSFIAALGKRKTLTANSPTKLAFAERMSPTLWAADRSLVFTGTKATAERLADAYRGQKLVAAALHSDIGPAHRQRIFDHFRAGDIAAIVAPRVLDEGVDVPAADLAIVVSAFRTRRQMVQRMGRVLRRKADGRLARLAVLYLRGTTEDPADGAHETFISEIAEVAEDLEFFDESEVDDALVFCCSMRPFEESPPPRLVGDPRRQRTRSASDATALPVATVLALGNGSPSYRGAG